MATPAPEIVQAIAGRTDPSVPPAVVFAIAERESTFDATPPDGAAGEVGLMQLLPSTVRSELGYMGPLEALYDPGFNVELGSRYLKILYGRVHSWPEAIRAWNGSGSAARAYAAAVVQRLPAWEQFVQQNLKVFQTAAGKRALSWGIVAVAALVALFLFAPRDRRAEAA